MSKANRYYRCGHRVEPWWGLNAVKCFECIFTRAEPTTEPAVQGKTVLRTETKMDWICPPKARHIYRAREVQP